jgi:hypothetical protein
MHADQPSIGDCLHDSVIIMGMQCVGTQLMAGNHCGRATHAIRATLSFIAHCHTELRHTHVCNTVFVSVKLDDPSFSNMQCNANPATCDGRSSARLMRRARSQTMRVPFKCNAVLSDQPLEGAPAALQRRDALLALLATGAAVGAAPQQALAVQGLTAGRIPGRCASHCVWVVSGRRA